MKQNNAAKLKETLELQQIYTLADSFSSLNYKNKANYLKSGLLSTFTQGYYY